MSRRNVLSKYSVRYLCSCCIATDCPCYRLSFLLVSSCLIFPLFNTSSLHSKCLSLVFMMLYVWILSKYLGMASFVLTLHKTMTTIDLSLRILLELTFSYLYSWAIVYKIIIIIAICLKLRKLWRILGLLNPSNWVMSLNHSALIHLKSFLVSSGRTCETSSRIMPKFSEQCINCLIQVLG